MASDDDPSGSRRFVQSSPVPPLMPPVGPGRVGWIDAARCFGIVFVVLGHVIRGSNEARLISDHEAFVLVDNLIYYFHMPLFFWLSGITSAVVQSHGSFWKNILWRIAVPYVFWSAALIVTKSLFASQVNSPATFEDLSRIAFTPVGPFWFLYALALMLACRHILRSCGAEAFLLPLSVGLFLLQFWVDLQQPVISAFCEFLLFFALGQSVDAGTFLSRRYSAMVGLLASVAFLATDILAGWLSIPYETFVGRLVSLGCLFALGFSFRSDLVQPFAENRFVQFIGRATMPIYCSHVFFIGIIRSILFRLHVESLSIHVVAGLLFGIVLPLVMLVVCQRLSVDRFVPGFDNLRPRSKLVTAN